jgi:hypothetical protein
MESHGVAGRVQVAESTRRLLAEPFLLEERGALEIEGLGEIKTWFLGGRTGGPDRGPARVPAGRPAAAATGQPKEGDD